MDSQKELDAKYTEKMVEKALQLGKVRAQLRKLGAQESARDWAQGVRALASGLQRVGIKQSWLTPKAPPPSFLEQRVQLLREAERLETELEEIARERTEALERLKAAEEAALAEERRENLNKAKQKVSDAADAVKKGASAVAEKAASAGKIIGAKIRKAREDAPEFEEGEGEDFTNPRHPLHDH